MAQLYIVVEKVSTPLFGKLIRCLAYGCSFTRSKYGYQLQSLRKATSGTALFMCVRVCSLDSLLPCFLAIIVQCCLQLSWDDPGMLLCNVGVLKTAQCTTVRQQWLVAGWLGPSVTVRVKVRARKWCFSLLFFLF